MYKEFIVRIVEWLIYAYNTGFCGRDDRWKIIL